MDVILICGFSFLVFAFLLGIPISFSLGMSAIVYTLFSGKVPIEALTHRMTLATDSWPLMAVPFFMLMGCALNEGKSGRYLMDFANLLVGWIWGGLSAVMVVINMFLGGCSGSSVADASSVGSVMIPEMIRRGFGKGYTASLNAAASTIGIIIPPSIPMILYAWVTETSIRKLFLSGVIPGILTGFSLMTISGYLSRKRGYPKAPKPQLGMIWPQFKKSFPALLIPIIVLGGILAGIYTTTEAAMIGALYVIVIETFLYKAFSPKKIWAMMVEASKVTGVVILMIATSFMLTYVIVISRLPAMIQETFGRVVPNGTIALLIITGFYLVTGCFLDLAPSLLIFTPIFFPFAVKFGVDPILLGLITTMVLGIGLFTPPVGSTLYISALIAKVTLEEASRDVVTFVAAITLIVVLVVLFPPIALWMTAF
jgi:tripartite ATP-independent transporter DctM subunit